MQTSKGQKTVECKRYQRVFKGCQQLSFVNVGGRREILCLHTQIVGTLVNSTVVKKKKMKSKNVKVQ